MSCIFGLALSTTITNEPVYVTGHVRYIDILTGLQSFQVKIAIFLSIFIQKKNNIKHRRLYRKPRSHILNIDIYRTCPIIIIFFIAMQRIIEQKTSEAIRKLEKQFKSTFSAYTSTNHKSRKHQAHKRLEGKTDCTQEISQLLKQSPNKIILTNLLKQR